MVIRTDRKIIASPNLPMIWRIPQADWTNRDVAAQVIGKLRTLQSSNQLMTYVGCKDCLVRRTYDVAITDAKNPQQSARALILIALRSPKYDAVEALTRKQLVDADRRHVSRQPG